MKLSHNSIKKLAHGAYRVEKEGGYSAFYSFTEAQIAVLKSRDTFLHERGLLSSGTTIEFVTDAKKISFDYKVEVLYSVDSLDVYCNDVLYKVIKTDTLDKKGNITIDLVGDKNKVVIYFPIDCKLLIKNLEIFGWYKAVKKRKNLLWLGDSITQGFGTALGSFTYQHVANRSLGYEVLNQGVGGYWYDEEIMQAMEGYQPEKIIVAYGTNQYRSADYYDRVEKFYNNLQKVYPNIPVLAITPIWRADGDNDAKELYKTNQKLQEILSRYPQVSFVDGFTLVPNVSEMFLDDLHPNALGMSIYAENLVKHIKKIKF